jgi:hypothetical protein
MPQLKDMIGQNIVALVPYFDRATPQLLKLHDVESGGIWVENQSFTDMALKKVGVQTAPKTPLFFLPWPSVTFVISSLDSPALSETAFGVES